MYFAQLFGLLLCNNQNGIGSTAPTMMAYNCGWYIDPPPNCLDGPIKPLQKHKSTNTQTMSIRKEWLKGNETHQIVLAVKNT